MHMLKLYHLNILILYFEFHAKFACCCVASYYATITAIASCVSLFFKLFALKDVIMEIVYLLENVFVEVDIKEKVVMKVHMYNYVRI